MSINRVTLTGRLTRDCEVRRTNSGFTIVSLGLAVNERRKNSQTGQWEDYANYFDCTCLGERYEKLSQYLTKGTQLAIDGKLRWSQWDGKGGQKRSKVEVIVDDVELLGSREDRQQGGSKPQAVKAEVIEPPSSVYDDDIPFN